MKNEINFSYISNFLEESYKTSKKLNGLYQWSEKFKIPSVRPYEGSFLKTIASIAKPKHILDVGCGLGISTSYLIDGFTNFKTAHAVDFNKGRIDKCRELFLHDDRVHICHSKVEQFLDSTDANFDFVFIDSIKKDYLKIYQMLKTKLLPESTLLFDDVLLYGYVSMDSSLVPYKYKEGVQSLQEFLSVILKEEQNASIVPIGSGMLLVHT